VGSRALGFSQQKEVSMSFATRKDVTGGKGQLLKNMSAGDMHDAMVAAIRAWAKRNLSSRRGRISVIRDRASTQDSVATFDCYERMWGSSQNRLARVVASVQFDGSVSIDVVG
jgi:hypothetical protein